MINVSKTIFVSQDIHVPQLLSKTEKKKKIEEILGYKCRQNRVSLASQHASTQSDSKNEKHLVLNESIFDNIETFENVFQNDASFFESDQI